MTMHFAETNPLISEEKKNTMVVSSRKFTKALFLTFSHHFWKVEVSDSAHVFEETESKKLSEIKPPLNVHNTLPQIPFAPYECVK